MFCAVQCNAPKSEDSCTVVHCSAICSTFLCLAVYCSVVQSCGSAKVRSSRARLRPFPALGRLSCYPTISARHVLAGQLGIPIHMARRMSFSNRNSFSSRHEVARCHVTKCLLEYVGFVYKMLQPTLNSSNSLHCKKYHSGHPSMPIETTALSLLRQQ